MLPECKFRCGKNKDQCKRWTTKTKCEPNTIDDFGSGLLEQCEIEQVCQKCSPYGNDFILLTDEDIEALKSGKVLYLVDEYGTFLAYKKGEN